MLHLPEGSITWIASLWTEYEISRALNCQTSVDLLDWSHPKMQELLPDYSLPGKLRAEQKAVVEHRMQGGFEPLQASINGLQREMSEMKQHTARIPEKQYVNQPDGSLLEIDTATGNRTTYRMLGF